MANIFVSYYKLQENDICKPQHTIEGFAEELAKCGNNVLTLNTSLFNGYNTNVVSKRDINDQILTAFEYFRPEVVFAFNHRIPQSILDHYKGKVIIYDGDHPDYFCGTDTILANKERYEIFSIVKGWKSDYEALGYDTKKIHYVPMATCVQKKDVPFDHNISFLGQRFLYSSTYQSLIGLHDFSHNIHAMLHEFYTTQNYDYVELFKKYFPEIWYTYQIEEKDLYAFFDVRGATLSALTELGMCLCAHGGRWEFLDTTFPQLAAGFDPRIVWGLQENIDFYNRSKLSLCPMHPQAKGAGFSWRALDVFASNSCLLSSESSELRELVRDYVDLPTFKSPMQAYALAKKLLENEDYRLSIVNSCQQYVDDHGRWIHRFREMEKILDIPLISENAEKGTVRHMYDDAIFMSIIDRYSPKKEAKPSASSKLMRRSVAIAEKYKPSSIAACSITMRKGLSYKIREALIRAVSSTILSRKKRRSFREKALKSLEEHPHSFFSDKFRARVGSLRFLSSKSRKKYRKICADIAHFTPLHERYAIRLADLKKSDRPIRVCFFVLLSSVFPGEPLFCKMLEDPKFSPFIVIIPDTQRGDENMKAQMIKCYNELSAKYKQVFMAYDEKSNTYTDYKDMIDIVCMVSPYDRMTHKFYTLDYLKEYCLSIFFNYTFSTLTYVHEVIRTDFMSQIWKVFLETDECLEELKKEQKIHGRNAVVSGYIKMDNLPRVTKQEGRRKKIFICPHHTVMGWSKLDLSHFLVYHELFLELPLMFKDVDFVFRPHPLLFVNLKKFSIWSTAEIDRYISKIESLPNMIYDQSGSYYEAFAESDGMIHDCGSFIAEYLYTEKPACYMLKNISQLEDTFLPIGKECMQNHYHAYTKEDIISFIQNVVIDGNDTMKKDRVNFVNKKLKINYPNVSDVVLKYLKKELDFAN